MPAPILYPTFAYAGGSAKLDSLSYTASVGITPGVAVVRVGPTAAAPPVAGDFAFSDGLNAITLRDCHVDRDGFRAEASPAGKYFNVRLLDRRWRWQDSRRICSAIGIWAAAMASSRPPRAIWAPSPVAAFRYRGRRGAAAGGPGRPPVPGAGGPVGRFLAPDLLPDRRGDGPAGGRRPGGRGVSGPWVPGRDAELTRLRAEGLSDVAAAARLGVSPSTAARIRKRLGLPNLAGPRSVAWTAEQSAAFAAGMAAGEDPAELAARLGRTLFAVYARREQLGMPCVTRHERELRRAGWAWPNPAAPPGMHALGFRVLATLAAGPRTEPALAADLGIRRPRIQTSVLGKPLKLMSRLRAAGLVGRAYPRTPGAGPTNVFPLYFLTPAGMAVLEAAAAKEPPSCPPP